MSDKVEVSPNLISWARSRSGRSSSELRKAFPKLDLWETGKSLPTISELQRFANATYTPYGLLLLETPPEWPLPVKDFRTIDSKLIPTPTNNLLETISLCKLRQDWYREYMITNQLETCTYVNSIDPSMEAEVAASIISSVFQFQVEDRRDCKTWSEALSLMCTNAEQVGVLVMISGVVGSNTHRKLDVAEFRGFSLADPYAPVVFINGADAKSAQLFSLCHEIAHLGIGQSAVSNVSLADVAQESTLERIERWCNKVAAEVLIPADSVRDVFSRRADLDGEVERLARHYKTSSIVVLRRLLDEHLISREKFLAAHGQLDSRKQKQSTGGDFYKVTPVRASKRFTRALLSYTMVGKTNYRDAAALLGLTKASTIDDLAARMGIL